MIGACLALLVLLGCALLIGQALAGLSHGARRGAPTPLSWLAPAYGLGGLLVLGAVAARLPGHAVTVAVVIALAALASAVYLRGRVAQVRARAPIALCAGLIAASFASLPFLIAGNVGVLGVGLVNDDMASHLIIADHVADPSGHVPSFVRGGYPIGPHALAAALDLIPGAGMVEAFAALTLSLAVLHALLGTGLLRGMPAGRRVAGAVLIALPYLGAAYLAQGAFKEPLQALLLIGFALAMGPLIGLRSPLSIGAPDASSAPPPGSRRRRTDEAAPGGSEHTLLRGFWPLGVGGPDHAEAPALAPHPILRVIPLAVLAAASVLNYSTPGLLWVVLVAAALIFTRVVIVRPRPRMPEIDWRKLAPYALGVILIVALATFQEWGRIADFSRISALNPDRFGSDLGNLSQSLSPLEALGIWPSGEFDATPTSTGVPAIVFYLGAAIGFAALLCGLDRDRRQHLEVVPTLLGAMAVVWALSTLFASPYIAAKALAVAAPVVMTLAIRGSFGAERGPKLLLGVVFVVLAAGSSFLVLRAAPVGPDDASSHGAQLESMREIVAGEKVLFLGRDDFIRWYLRGSDEITGIVTNFYDVEDARPRFKKGEGGGEKFDVDAVFPATLDRFPYVLESTGGPSSLVPPRFEEAARTRDYVLYERTGGTGKRKTLDEGREPGAFKRCLTPEEKELQHSQGTATIWDPAPVIEGAAGWRPDDSPSDGSPSSIEIEIPRAGRWLISLAYDSRRPLHITSQELGIDETITANLDFRGATPTFPIAEVEVEGRLRATVLAEPVRPNFAGRILRAPNEAHLRELTATPIAATKRIPIRQACDEYVDWYRTTKVNRERIPAENRGSATNP